MDQGTGYPLEVKALIMLWRCRCRGRREGCRCAATPKWQGNKELSAWWIWGENYGSGDITGGR